MNQNHQNQPGENRPLTEEERRRLQAARRAAMERAQAGNPARPARGTERPDPAGGRTASAPRRSDPYGAQPGTAAPRRSNPYADPYGAQAPRQGNPYAEPYGAPERGVPRRSSPEWDGRTAPRTRQHKSTMRRRKKPVRVNVGLVAFLVMILIVLGVSLWQILRPAAPAEGIGQDAAAAAEPSGGETSRNETESAEARDGVENDAAGSEPSASQAQTEQFPAAGTDAPGTQTPAAQAPAAQTGETKTPSSGEPGKPQEPAEINLTLYDTVQVSNTSLNAGDLILVNNAHYYSAGDTIELKNIYAEMKNPPAGVPKIKVATSSVSLAPAAFSALCKMAADLQTDTGSHDLHVNSGHRTVAEQQQVWDYYLELNGEEYCNNYVARPGYSEHNTGLACDLSFYTDAGEAVSVSNYEFGWWLAENCAKEGFILRYAADKVDITGISNEPWHFRYVGVPHAYVCTAKNWCLEEYVENVKNYTAEGTMLRVTSAGEVSEVRAADGLPRSDGWLIYCVPKAIGTETAVKVPRGSDYEISGNNVDAFIVTITLD